MLHSIFTVVILNFLVGVWCLGYVPYGNSSEFSTLATARDLATGGLTPTGIVTVSSGTTTFFASSLKCTSTAFTTSFINDGPDTDTFTITLTTGMAKLRRRDQNLTTVTVPAVTTTIAFPCQVTITSHTGPPDEKVTVTQLVPLPSAAHNNPQTTTTSPTTSLTSAPTQNVPPTTSVSPTIPAASPAGVTNKQLNNQPSGTLYTTIGSSSVTIVTLPSSAGAVINGVTVARDAAATTINGVVLTFGPSGLFAIPTSTTTTSLGAIIMSQFASGAGNAVATQTLSPGNTFVVSGTTFSVQTGGLPAVAIRTMAGAGSAGAGSGSPSITPGGTVVISGTAFIIPTAGASGQTRASSGFSSSPTSFANSSAPIQITGGASKERMSLLAVGSTLFVGAFVVCLSF